MLFPPRKLHPYCRSERDTANKHTVQHKAICSAQVALGIIKSLFAPNHGPLLSAPFTCFSCILPCASVAGGVSRPRSGALVFNIIILTTSDRILCSKKWSGKKCLYSREVSGYLGSVLTISDQNRVLWVFYFYFQVRSRFYHRSNLLVW